MSIQLMDARLGSLVANGISGAPLIAGPAKTKSPGSGWSPSSLAMEALVFCCERGLAGSTACDLYQSASGHYASNNHFLGGALSTCVAVVEVCGCACCVEVVDAGFDCQLL